MKKLGNKMSSLTLLLMLVVLGSACSKIKPAVANKGTGSKVAVSETEATNLSGKWSGPMETTKFTAQMELALAREGTQLSAEAKFAKEALKSAKPIRDLKVSGNDISFKTELGGADVHFNGHLNGDKLSGTVTAFQGTAIVATGTWNLLKS
jgi:hypothetical protein